MHFAYGLLGILTGQRRMSANPATTWVTKNFDPEFNDDIKTYSLKKHMLAYWTFVGILHL